MQDPIIRVRRSALFVPASNERALHKAPALACDAVIYDLEDSVSSENKETARAGLARMLKTRTTSAELVIRVNSMSSPWGADDLSAVAECDVDALLLPKVETPADIVDVSSALAVQGRIRQIWAMIETPRGVINCGQIAEVGQACNIPLSCLIAGTNDLAKETGVSDRRYLAPWLMQIVLASKAWGLTALDGVGNDFRALDAFTQECVQGAAMGFDGKTLIHPNQITPANRAFSPTADAIEAARRIVALFDRAENANANVVTLNGHMIERLHLTQARSLLAKLDAIENKNGR